MQAVLDSSYKYLSVPLFQMKCLEYWPTEEGDVKNFGDFYVTLKSTETFADFSMNILQVSKVNTNLPRTHCSGLT